MASSQSWFGETCLTASDTQLEGLLRMDGGVTECNRVHTIGGRYTIWRGNKGNHLTR